MTLAARYRGMPVLLGAVVAFALLNLAAVLFGATLAAWIPKQILTGCVALLFAIFGIQALRTTEEDHEEISQKSGHGIFFTAFLMIFMAEFGDKTQLAVAGLSSAAIPAAIWAGATLALATTSTLGVWAGRKLLQKISIVLLHRISGVLFILLAIMAAIKTVSMSVSFEI